MVIRGEDLLFIENEISKLLPPSLSKHIDIYCGAESRNHTNQLFVQLDVKDWHYRMWDPVIPAKSIKEFQQHFIADALTAFRYSNVTQSAK